jgi:hypothetical protein
MSTTPSVPPVAISFDCTPLRAARGVAAPAEASPGYRALVGRMQRAAERHGTRNAYYLSSGRCTFRFTNSPAEGLVEFAFEGTLLTDEGDTRCVGSDLEIRLDRETCDWLTQPAVEWLTLSARRAVETEFDRYIRAGDLERTKERLLREQAASDASGGFLGMNL